MSGGGDKTTQVSSSEPYGASKPLLDRGMKDALSLYKGGGLVKPNTMSTVVPYAQQTMQGMNNIQGMANANMGPNGLQGQYQNIIDAGGYNQEQQDALGGIRSTAMSEFDPYNNPAFKQVLDQSLEKSMMGVNANAAAMGRYGAGTHQGVMQKEQGDLASRMIGNEYGNWQNRRDAAQTQLFNAGQQGQQNLSSAFDAMQAPSQALMGIGSMYEDLAGRQLNDQLRIAQEKQNAPLANIQALLGVASGAGNYGSQKQTAQMPSNTFSNIAGGALGGASLLSQLGLF